MNEIVIREYLFYGKDEHQAAYRWVDIDRDRAGEQFVIQTSRCSRSIPTIVFPDGSILVEPSNEQLTTKLYRTRLG
ncbi:MAG: hypothetical protein Fur0016_29340 [Anaerolineales bacterium]